MERRHENARLEAFSDGVFAFALTLLIVQVKIPPVGSIHSVSDLWNDLANGWPQWFGFLLSFSIILVAWSNHHIVFKLIDKSSIQFVYANGFLLLTIVIMPFTTGLMAEYLLTEYAQPAVTLYCFGKLLNNIAWNVLAWSGNHPYPLLKDGVNAQVLAAGTRKVMYGTILYLTIFVISFWLPLTAMVLTTVSWAVWIILGLTVSKAMKPE